MNQNQLDNTTAPRSVDQQQSCSAVCRAYTQDEAKDAFLNHVRALVEYWAKVDERDVKEKLSGLAFSILNIFDGTTISLPAMDIVLRPHESDEQYCRDNGENWWPDGLVINEVMLHDEFYSPNTVITHDERSEELGG